MTYFTRPARLPYADPPPDTGHVMQALTRLEGKVDTMTHILRSLLRSLADEGDVDAEDLLSLEGGPAGAERDSTKPL